MTKEQYMARASQNAADAWDGGAASTGGGTGPPDPPAPGDWEEVAAWPGQVHAPMEGDGGAAAWTRKLSGIPADATVLKVTFRYLAGRDNPKLTGKYQGLDIQNLGWLHNAPNGHNWWPDPSRGHGGCVLYGVAKRHDPNGLRCTHNAGLPHPRKPEGEEKQRDLGKMMNFAIHPGVGYDVEMVYVIGGSASLSINGDVITATRSALTGGTFPGNAWFLTLGNPEEGDDKRESSSPGAIWFDVSLWVKRSALPVDGEAASL